MPFFKSLPGIVQFLIVIGVLALLVIGLAGIDRDEGDGGMN